MNHTHYWKFESPAGHYSQAMCDCGAITSGLNGFPDNAYNFENDFPLTSNSIIRPRDNPIDLILECRKSPHVFDRRY
jgi:hypothetical protein